MLPTLVLCSSFTSCIKWHEKLCRPSGVQEQKAEVLTRKCWTALWEKLWRRRPLCPWAESCSTCNQWEFSILSLFRTNQLSWTFCVHVKWETQTVLLLLGTFSKNPKILLCQFVTLKLKKQKQKTADRQKKSVVHRGHVWVFWPEIERQEMGYFFSRMLPSLGNVYKTSLLRIWRLLCQEGHW